MSLDTAAVKPIERLASTLAGDMAQVNEMIRDRMASEHAPRIPEITAHLVEAGGKRLRPMLTPPSNISVTTQTGPLRSAVDLLVAEC